MMKKTILSNKFHSLSEELVNFSVKGKPFYISFPIAALQLLFALCRDLSDSQLSLRAMSLVYTTLITLVPLLALSFSVLKGFGVHNQIEPALLNLLEGLGPSQSKDVAERIVSFVNNIEVGVLGVVGLGLLIYMVINLMQKIESAFNNIWRVAKARSFAERIGDYLTALLVGPLLIFLSTGITATFRHTEIVTQLEGISALGHAFDAITILLPWIVLAIGFSALYIFMPNTKVSFKAAFVGGLSAAMIWKLLGLIFSVFIAQSASHVAIYAAFATLITFMIWIYLSWSVILLGSSIAFYVQNPRYIKISRTRLILSPRLYMQTGIGCVQKIGEAHYQQKTLPTDETLSRDFNLPVLAIQNILNVLEAQKIIIRSADGLNSYYPACPFEKTKMETLFEALESSNEKGMLSAHKIKSSAVVKDIFDQLNKSRYEAVGQKTIFKTLIDIKSDTNKSTKPKKTK